LWPPFAPVEFRFVPARPFLFPDFFLANARRAAHFPGMRFASVAACFCAAVLAAPGADLKLPDVLLATNGTLITTPEAWRTMRRAEVLELFRENVYGRMPIGKPESLKFEITESATNAMEGKATRKQVRIAYRGPGGAGAIRLVLFVPKERPRPAPAFLLICNRSVTNIDPSRQIRSDFWPAEQIVARGYAAAAFFNGDVVADKHDEFKSGVHAIFDPPSGRQSNSWGTIAAWAWGASRVMDYFESDPRIDARHVAVVGHSRGGKTALWAGAEDERFAFVISNDSGSTGAAIARHKKGEQIANINKGFPHWFSENYKRYNGREDALPVDQHMLVALMAPRLVYVASAAEDTWADPTNEFLATVHASPVYELLGLKGVSGDKFPPLDSPLHAGRIGYHVRSGKHNLTLYDWQQFMDFADRQLSATR
jgi:dienelactone hydrolase